MFNVLNFIIYSLFQQNSYDFVYHQCLLADACNVQINYLIDEAMNVGKGANVIISLVHHVFQPMAWMRMWHIYMQTTVLVRTRIIIYNVLPDVESFDWPTLTDNRIFPPYGPYKVLPGCWVWDVEEEV